MNEMTYPIEGGLLFKNKIIIRLKMQRLQLQQKENQQMKNGKH